MVQADSEVEERPVEGAPERLVRLERDLLVASQEVHRLNREVARLEEQLREERVEREELLTVVSHEVRTPLTVIGGYHRLLLDARVGALNPEQERFLLQSQRSCAKLGSFLEKVLEAERHSLTGRVPEVRSAPLAPVVSDVVASLRPLAEERGVRLVLDVDGCEARFDRSAIERVLMNLVGNAARYASPEGVIEIAARKIEQAGRACVEVSVADDGPGVPPADRSRIFEPYVQLGADGRAGGLGLGLAICRRLVEAHGGSIGVTERPGGGSRFAFTLAQEDL